MFAHVVIRRDDYVAGTRERPEVGIFTRTHAARRPVPWGRVGRLCRQSAVDKGSAGAADGLRDVPGRDRDGGGAGVAADLDDPDLNADIAYQATAGHALRGRMSACALRVAVLGRGARS